MCVVGGRTVSNRGTRPVVAAVDDDLRRRGGRPLDVSRDDDLRRAALELVAEVGYDRLTIDAVVARAGAGKGTVYRRWSGKAELVVDAVSALRGGPRVPDTGSLRGDLEAITCGIEPISEPFESEVMAGLASALVHDVDLHRSFQDHFIAPRTKVFAAVFSQAVERGEIPPERNLDLLVDLFPALVLRRLLLTGKPPDTAFARLVIDDVILPLATAPAAPSARSGRSTPKRPSK